MQTSLFKDSIVWSKRNCQACDTVKDMLAKHGYAIEVRYVDTEHGLEDFRKNLPDAKSVPQVYLNGKYIGGLREVREFLGYA